VSLEEWSNNPGGIGFFVPGAATSRCLIIRSFNAAVPIASHRSPSLESTEGSWGVALNRCGSLKAPFALFFDCIPNLALPFDVGSTLNECFYEKVIRIKADVAAVLTIGPDTTARR
jgi:hypothetical protein